MYSANSLSLSTGQRPHLRLKWVGVISTRTRLLTFSQLELELLHLLRPIFQYSVTLSLMLDGVMSPEEENNGNFT